MKSIFLIFFSLLLMNGSNDFVKCSCPKKIPVDSEEKCALCKETHGACEEFASEDNKVSLKKLIIQLLKKVNLTGGNSQVCFEECTHCKHVCSKKRGIASVLVNILKKACFDKEEDESIREIIIKLLEESDCKRNPCQPHCDPQIQEILRGILRRAAGCGCRECPLNCVLNPPPSDGDKYKYWFRTTKDNLRREYANAYKSRPKLCETNPECCQVEKRREACPHEKRHKGKNKEGCDLPKCKRCRKPENLICPRYVDQVCSMRHKDDLFTICADSKECYTVTASHGDNVILFCGNCNALNSPFVQFTPNGSPLKRAPERRSGIKIKTKFLQVNDFRLNEEGPKKTVFNPFRPKCNIPRKKKLKRK